MIFVLLRYIYCRIIAQNDRKRRMQYYAFIMHVINHCQFNLGKPSQEFKSEEMNTYTIKYSHVM